MSGQLRLTQHKRFVPDGVHPNFASHEHPKEVGIKRGSYGQGSLRYPFLLLLP